MTDQPIEQCIRRTLEIIRDELRLRSAKYEGLRHEKLFSPLPVSVSGWEAFATAHRIDESTERWHVEKDGGWLGRFTGEVEGVAKFEEFAHIFARVTGRSLLDVVHDFAVLGATPLLSVVPSVWNWEPHEHLHEDGYVEDVEPFLEEWDESSKENARYPQHPLVRQLNGNVFFSAAVAIDLVLTPESLFLRRPFDPDDMPLSVGELTEAETYSCPVSASPAEETEEPEIEFLFRKTGDTWQIRYTTGQTTEFGVFSDIKGLSRYATLLESPHRFFPSLEFDSAHLDAIKSAVDESDVDGDNSRRETRYEHRLSWQELRELRQGIEELQDQKNLESDPAREKRLSAEINIIKRKLYSGLDISLLESHAQKAHRKIKKSLYDARAKLRKGNMPQLADHLEAFVLPEGYRYAYRPDRQIHWTI